MDDVAAIARPGAVAQYHRSISLLRQLRVPARLLARLFQTSSDNIRQVDSRVYEDVSLGSPPSATNLLRDFADELEWEVLRKKSPRANRLRNRRQLESLEQQLNADFGQCAKSEQFGIGAEALRTFLPHVANAAHPEVLRLRALVYQHIAWLLVHNGQSEQALKYAREAMTSALQAFDNSLGERRFLKEYSEAALITSNALLTTHRPDDALTFLDEADSAVLAREGKIGQEHYRQRATALFQKHQDQAALKQFGIARTAAEEKGYENVVQVQMASERQMNVLSPGKGISKALDLCEGAKQFFGPESIEYVMTVHWAAAAALSTDSESEIKEALKLLTEAAPAARQFGHQATISFLLSITPSLKLALPERTFWIRFLLYENSSRPK